MSGVSRTILLGDIGGTNARFALLSDGAPSHQYRQRTDDHRDPESAVRAYLDATGAPLPSIAVMAVAGPVRDGRARLTNAAWTFDPDKIEDELGIGRVVVVNDFAAQAWALAELADKDVRPIGTGAEVEAAPRLVIGAGTGLGAAAYMPADAGMGERVVTGEAGHATLAAADDGQEAVLRPLRLSYGRVSAERVLSGPGLAALAGAVAEMHGKDAPGTTPEAVLAAARAGDTVAGEAVALFRAFMGAFAGDLALVFGAWGGVYLSGGLVRAMAAELDAPAFREAFEAKGRFREAVAAVPAWIVTHPDPAFLGLARLARRLGD